MTDWMPDALAQLGQDKKLGNLIEIHGKPKWTPTGDPFTALTQSLVYQQLSGKAAATIYNRFAALMPGGLVSPAHVLDRSFEELRGAGLSGQKATYVQELAKAFAGDTLPERFSDLDDESVRAVLKPIKGIGDWTIDMFLLFDLCRPDVWPTGDLGVRKGVAGLIGMKERLPTVAEMLATGEVWKPYRSVAAWYMWRSLETPGRA